MCCSDRQSGRAKPQTLASATKRLKELFRTFLISLLFSVFCCCVQLVRAAVVLSFVSATPATDVCYNGDVFPLWLKVFNVSRKMWALNHFTWKKERKSYMYMNGVMTFSMFQGWLHCSEQNSLYVSPLGTNMTFQETQCNSKPTSCAATEQLSVLTCVSEFTCFPPCWTLAVTGRPEHLDPCLCPPNPKHLFPSCINRREKKKDRGQSQRPTTESPQGWRIFIS